VRLTPQIRFALPGAQSSAGLESQHLPTQGADKAQAAGAVHGLRELLELRFTSLMARAVVTG